MTFDEPEKRAPGRSSRLQQQIEELEVTMRAGWKDIERRPLSARSTGPGFYRPRAPVQPPASGSVSARGASPRRPLTAVSAYRRAGLDPDTFNSLLPSTATAIENWRASSKYEEQMLLGHLRAEKARLKAKPLWKLPQFERVPPRIE